MLSIFTVLLLPIGYSPTSDPSKKGKLLNEPIIYNLIEHIDKSIMNQVHSIHSTELRAPFYRESYLGFVHVLNLQNVVIEELGGTTTHSDFNIVKINFVTTTI